MTDPFAIAGIATALAAATILAWRLGSARQKQRAAELEWHERREADLVEARNSRNLLLDALGDPFLLIDANARIIFANEAGRELFGSRDLTGRPIADMLLDTRLMDQLRHCLMTGEPVRERVVLPQQSSPRGIQETRGANAWIIDAARLPATNGHPVWTRVLIRDVTAEHQLEQVRKDFVANASHELRTPLAIINGYLENLLDGDLIEDTATSRRFLAIMQKHADRISRIVEDMLVISKLESGEASALKIEPFRFSSCIHDVLERLESVIAGQDAVTHVIMPDPNLVLAGDRFYWTQVLFNLVENALKQNPRGALRVEIGCEAVGDAIRIWVSDNGVGIPSADLAHIFRRFFRVEKHHSNQEIKGTGLGLSIVKRAVEAHRGTIGVTSTPGHETKFLITLPREAEVSAKEAII